MRNLLLSVLILLLLITGLSCKKSSETIIGPVVNKNVKIGVMLSMTGSGSSTGESSKAAIDLAIYDIGIYLQDIGSDMQFNFIIEDTKTDSSTSKEVIAALYQKGARLIIGPYSSASVIAVKGYANQNGILVCTPSSVAPSLAIANDNVFRMAPSDQNQAEAMRAFLNDDTLRVIVPIVRDDVWGNELLNATSLQWNQAGGIVAEPVKYDPVSLNLLGYVTQLKDKVADALNNYPAEKIGVYMVSFGEGTDILRLASTDSTLVKVKWYGSSAYAENKSLPEDLTAATFAQNQFLSCPIFGYDDAAEDLWKPLNNRIIALIDRKPEIYALAAYDAIWLAVLTYLKTGANPDISYLKSTFILEADAYFGATGRTTFNETGDRKFAFYDFWGIDYQLNQYYWRLVAKYNNATGILERYN